MKGKGMPTRSSAALPSPCAQGRVPSGRRLGVRVGAAMSRYLPASLYYVQRETAETGPGIIAVASPSMTLLNAAR